MKAALLIDESPLPANCSTQNRSNHLDLEFVVPFKHRVRFSDDIAGAQFDQLLQLLDPEASEQAKVLLLAEASVSESNGAVQSIRQRLSTQASVDLVGCQTDFDGGEAIKNDSRAVEQVLRLINDSNLDRRSYVVAIGGGAFLDAVGYASAIAHRGVRLVRLPTTTLAQADSGVGVKNAINYFNKKNWVGTFSVPWAVINDAALLTTLPDQHFRCGFAEAVKVSALKDVLKFNWLCDHASQIARREMPIAIEAIKQSCIMHLKHIVQGGDAFEALEARPLDFGHWSAHRLEALSGYRCTHGEAVSIGVALDSVYSNLALGLPEQDMRQILKCLHDLSLPLWHPILDSPQNLMQGLEEFRQHLGGRLTLTMLRSIGDPIDVHNIDASTMQEAIFGLKILGEKLARA